MVNFVFFSFYRHKENTCGTLPKNASPANTAASHSLPLKSQAKERQLTKKM